MYTDLYSSLKAAVEAIVASYANAGSAKPLQTMDVIIPVELHIIALNARWGSIHNVL